MKQIQMELEFIHDPDPWKALDQNQQMEITEVIAKMILTIIEKQNKENKNNATKS